ncbi:uncharacterized protein LOC132609695 [Lycium barbarum]|uniref:uncharacterized protein LOC132609695 n=1 Tax=Lycium barbarum TaxID=112863 RepID=UPI00293E6BF5|nr:uncharacterized protein LOC132609695 [Lycium barbarum]
MDLQNNNEHGRQELNKANAEYVKWLGIQDNLLRQKSQIKWFQEGDYNSRYFHILNHIPHLITEENNNMLTKIPKEEEIKDAIFNLSSESTAGPDGFNGTFFQKCWDIIKSEVIDFVQEYFNGRNLTKFYNHTCLVLIPKVISPTSFSQMRPISLTNFTTKIISKILSSRLNTLLPLIISENQSGFVQGRLIIENVMLA